MSRPDLLKNGHKRETWAEWALRVPTSGNYMIVAFGLDLMHSGEQAYEEWERPLRLGYQLWRQDQEVEG